MEAKWIMWAKDLFKLIKSTAYTWFLFSCFYQLQWLATSNLILSFLFEFKHDQPLIWRSVYVWVNIRVQKEKKIDINDGLQESKNSLKFYGENFRVNSNFFLNFGSVFFLCLVILFAVHFDSFFLLFLYFIIKM